MGSNHHAVDQLGELENGHSSVSFSDGFSDKMEFASACACMVSESKESEHKHAMRLLDLRVVEFQAIMSLHMHMKPKGNKPKTDFNVLFGGCNFWLSFTRIQLCWFT